MVLGCRGAVRTIEYIEYRCAEAQKYRGIDAQRYRGREVQRCRGTEVRVQDELVRESESERE
jgi:hypothetical protein